MKKSNGPTAEPRQVSKSLEQRLHGYAAAAGAAGVGLLALAQPAQAEVIHRVVNVTLESNQSYTLDLNKIGVGDFVITASATLFSSGGHQNGITVSPIGSKNAVWVSSVLFFDALALGNDVTIGPSGNFRNQSTLILARYYNNGNDVGDWQNVKGKFLGFKYVDLAGRPHYGWARLNVVEGVATIVDYEFNNTENTPVTTCKGSSTGSAAESKSPTLGHLAAGASALSDWRSDDSAAK